tara:strand:- start:652 stop:1182 length:531 start_codon:yes stop_codon:yes gene_type:complete
VKNNLKDVGYVIVKDWIQTIVPDFTLDLGDYTTQKAKTMGKGWYEILDINTGHKPIGRVNPFSIFEDEIKKIVLDVYGIETIISSRIQLSRDGAFIPSHGDSNSDDVLHFIIYLNSKTSKGGELILTDRNDDSETYIPSFGDLVILDLIQGKPVIHSVKPTYWDRFVMSGYGKRGK